MAENETPADQVRSVMAKNLEQAHAAIQKLRGAERCGEL
jgi:hypothetical protein